ncbi:MAG TPA: N-6 DNA methylase [Sphingomicrobium sp.]|nr:N-6 DNA methylase [Sphingomicrobium sp.]
MSLLDRIEGEFLKLGYRADTLRRDYAFSDVWGENGATCRVAFAAFTQTPPSYRSAAFGVIEAAPEAAAEAIRARRALGAPVFLVIEPDQVSAWQVHAKARPERIGTFTVDALASFFAERAESWGPDRIHRAKSIGHFEPEAQLDFVDAGLIPAIAGEIHGKLDRLIREAVSGTRAFSGDDAVRVFFRGVFRLLAAKILTDREHERAASWNAHDVRSVLNAMDDYYRLGNVSQAWPPSAIAALNPVWEVFRAGFNVSNISADDLAYVYESTLVTDQARADFGTHSTPRHVADYIVGRLRLWEYGENPPRVVEPFTGAGVFLGSALRLLRDALPGEWDDKQRHDLLVRCIGGAEIDPFAAEVAKLSLILADYPNANGWQIDEADLFEPAALRTCLEGARVILCNPPFERFKNEEARRYPEALAISRSKAVYALEMALRAKPDMLGFVLPNTVLVDRRYARQRIALERDYDEIELVALPDGIFNVSQANSALVIARKSPDLAKQQLRAATVLDRDKKAFTISGAPSLVRERSRVREARPGGDLWITPSQEIWDALADRPTLGTLVEGSWGLRWRAGQRARTSALPGLNRELGYQDTSSIHQFYLGEPRWMDVTPEHLLAGGNLDWDAPKILCNATRLSRGYWRLAAAVDRHGRRATQQFIGMWPVEGPDVDLDAITAVINSPVVNAYLTEHSFDKRFRIAKLHDAPIPATLPAELGDLSRRYAAAAQVQNPDTKQLARMLAAIDDCVFTAYGLDESARAELLSRMGSDRPVIGAATRRRRIAPSQYGLAASELFREVERDRGTGLGTVVSRAIGEKHLSAKISPLPLADWAGEVRDAAGVEAELGVPKGALARLAEARDVIALRLANGAPVYPLEQFAAGKPLGGIPELLGIIGAPEVAWAWLRTARPALDLPAPLALLKRGEVARVLDLAARDFG